jgi:ribosomal protein S18 acetylase RimI-like enzyme
MNAMTEKPEVTLREARREDIPVIVAMLADDVLGATRESPHDLTPYHAAFEQIVHDPNNRILIAESGGAVVGTLQLNILWGLARKGAKRAQIEAVRVSSAHRGKGFGEAIFRAAIGMARREGCALVQLSTDKNRKDAHRFYERLGFKATHEGMKLALT